MSLWILLLIVCGAGAIGGIVNALLSDNQGFLLPGFTEVAAGQGRIFRPGFIGTVFIGAVAAGISWGLYGPLAALNIVGAAAAGTPSAQAVGLTLSSLVGGVLVGIAGARWITNEVDKTLLRAAAAQAASKGANANAAQQMMSASPAEALRVAREVMQ